jgi:hypothetical protein
MRSLWTTIFLTGSGTTTVCDYELEQLRRVADVRILATEDVPCGGRIAHRYTVRYVVSHPATHLGPPAGGPHAGDGGLPMPPPAT